MENIVVQSPKRGIPFLIPVGVEYRQRYFSTPRKLLERFAYCLRSINLLVTRHWNCNHACTKTIPLAVQTFFNINTENNRDSERRTWSLSNFQKTALIFLRPPPSTV